VHYFSDAMSNKVSYYGKSLSLHPRLNGEPDVPKVIVWHSCRNTATQCLSRCGHHAFRLCVRSTDRVRDRCIAVPPLVDGAYVDT
jgi:hypothetical protein